MKETLNPWLVFHTKKTGHFPINHFSHSQQPPTCSVVKTAWVPTSLCNSGKSLASAPKIGAGVNDHIAGAQCMACFTLQNYVVLPGVNVGKHTSIYIKHLGKLGTQEPSKNQVNLNSLNCLRISHISTGVERKKNARQKPLQVPYMSFFAFSHGEFEKQKQTRKYLLFPPVFPT